jgi:hypothetical protein
MSGVVNDTSFSRSSRLVRPLSMLEQIRPLTLLERSSGVVKDLDIVTETSVLSIGPRTEAEIFLLWAYGFKLELIKGLRLISYCTLATLGDVHDIPF